MKRRISILLTMVMLVSVLAACGEKNDSPASPDSASPTSASTPTTAAAASTPTTAATTEEGSGNLPAYTGGPAELRFGWWGDDNRATITNNVIVKFMEAYPDIKVTGEPNGGTADHFAIIDIQLQGNNAPDLIQFGGNYPDYEPYLLPLDQFLGKQLMVNTPELFDQTALVPATLNNNLLCVSLGTNTLVLAYNKTMLEAAGAQLPKDNMTWDELTAYGNELKAKLPEGVYPFVDNSTNQANYLSYYYQQQGTPIWTTDDGGKSYATLDSAKKWLQLWADMRSQDLIPDADTTATYAETGADSSALVAGRAAIGMIWSNQIAGYQAAMTDTLAATTLPAGGEKSYAIQMSQYLGINKDTKYPEAAALFVNFFVTSPEAGALLGTNRGIPCSPQVRNAISASATEYDAAVYHIYDVVADRTVPQGPNLPNDQEFVSELQLIGQSIAYGKTTVDEGAADLQTLIERLITK